MSDKLELGPFSTFNFALKELRRKLCKYDMHSLRVLSSDMFSFIELAVSMACE